MSVVTLTPKLLTEACRQLSRRVRTGGCEPVLIVGILHGGAEVARLMKKDFKNAAYCDIRLSRPSTRHKDKGMGHSILQILPMCLCDILRILESRINEWRSKDKEPIRICEINLPEDISRLLWESDKGTTVLLVDDAIDTGATILQARRQLLENYPNINIKVAVITVTTRHPSCDADFCLYHNRTLCRFPWSNDYRD